jgi:hypothetical protein
MSDSAFSLCGCRRFLYVAPWRGVLFGARHGASSMPFEELYGTLMLFRFLKRRERAQVATLAGLGILFARIQPVFARFQFANHVSENIPALHQ